MLTIIIKNKLLQAYLQHRLLINCVLLAVLFLVNCFWGGMAYIVYPLLLLMVCFDNQENSITYLFFCVPFFYLKAYVSVVLYVACVLIFIARFYATQYFVEKKRPKLLGVILVGVLFVYCLLPIGAYNLNLILKTGLLLVIFAVLGMISKNAAVFRLHFNVRVVALVLLIASVYGLLYFVSPYLQEHFRVYHVSDDFTRFKALFVQPNILAMVCEIVCSIFAYYIISKQARLVDYLLFLAVSVLGLLTFSKTFLILIGIIYFAIFIWLLRQDFAKTVCVALVVVAVVMCLCTVNHEVVSVYFGRFAGTFGSCHSFADYMNMLTTNRYNLWTVYLNYLVSHPLSLIFGQGLGAPALQGWSKLPPHNFLLAMIYQLGLVGTGLFIAIVVLMIREFLRTKTKSIHPAICVPLIILGLLLCVEDFILYIF